MAFKILTLILTLISFTSCNTKLTNDEDGVIGEKLQTISPIAGKADAAEKSKVAIFDHTTRVVHQFDFKTMTHERTLRVTNPTTDHFLLYHEDGNYTIDISHQNITVFNAVGTPQISPFKLMGKPISAAVNSTNGYFIIYDDLSSVGVMKINNLGNITEAWAGGPVVSTDLATIASGDITEDGRLVLAMSDNSISVVDLNQTLIQKKWVFTNFATANLTKILWIAPVRGQNNQFLVRATNAVALLDINAQSIISQINIASHEKILKASKSLDPHVVFRNDTNEIRVIHVSNSQLVMRSGQTNSTIDKLARSFLNLSEDLWTYIQGSNYYYSTHDLWATHNDSSDAVYNRSLVRVRFSDMLAQKTLGFRDHAQLELTNNNVFALMPSELGYAINYDLANDKQTEAKLFNLKHIE